MHPVIAKLSPTRRLELFACPDFASLSDTRKDQLLDEVVKIRAALDYQDRLDVVYDQDALKVDAAEISGALNTALTILGRNRQITADMIFGLSDSRYPKSYSGIADLETFRMISRRMLATAERIKPEPRDKRQKRNRREARALYSVLADFGVKVVMTTPSKNGVRNYGFELISHLAHPPTSSDVIRQRLRR
jgi:hypothetical protein